MNDWKSRYHKEGSTLEKDIAIMTFTKVWYLSKKYRIHIAYSKAKLIYSIYK